MGKIDELIKELCPDGVEYAKLGDYCSVTIGEFIHKDNQTEKGKYPVYNGGTSYTGFYDRFNNTANKVIMSARGANAGYVNLIRVDYWAGNSCYSISPLKENTLLDFIYYYLKLNREYLLNQQQKGGIPAISKQQVENLQVPLPPLSIQQQIVEILDTFTDSISNLQEELELREKQMEYYRENLLSFDGEEVEWKSIKDIGRIVRGNGLQKKDFTDEGVGCIHYGQIYTRFGLSTDKTLTFVDSKLADKLTKVESGNLVIACTSENIEDVCKSVVWQGTQTIVTGGHACVLKHHENPKYIGYCFTSYSFQSQKIKHAYGAKVIDIKTEKLGEIRIPVPSITRQQEIVDILDTFESMITNIKEELELRQKQYEYYREKLLTFERKEV